MGMKHTCYICGNVSKDFAEISACRAQGKKNKHKLHELITFRSPASGEVLSGEIVEIAYKRKTHEVIYTVRGKFGFSGVSEGDILRKSQVA